MRGATPTSFAISLMAILLGIGVMNLRAMGVVAAAITVDRSHRPARDEDVGALFTDQFLWQPNPATAPLTIDVAA